MVILILQEGGRSPAGSGFEGLVTQWVRWLELGVETLGALIILAGVLIAFYRVMRAIVSPQPAPYYRIRLVLSRFLALALEFQLAADILGTAVSPGWNQIGRLGAIATIRTALNYFLSREIRAEEADAGHTPRPRAVAAGSSAS